MCLSKAFLEDKGKNKLVMSDIASVSVTDGKVILRTLFGEKREVEAAIREIDFTSSRLTLTTGKSK